MKQKQAEKFLNKHLSFYGARGLDILKLREVSDTLD